MSDYEIVFTIITILSLILSFACSLFSILYINKRKELYLIKKEAIFETLNFLDDFLSTTQFSDIKPVTSIKNEQDKENLTLRARVCFNKLIATCKNPEIIDAFCKIIFPQHYYKGKDTIKLEDYHIFRMLCRQELGLKKEPNYNKYDIVFISVIKVKDF